LKSDQVTKGKRMEEYSKVYKRIVHVKGNLDFFLSFLLYFYFHCINTSYFYSFDEKLI